MTRDELNALPDEAAREAFTRCCGANRWVEGMVAGRPYSSPEDLFEAAEVLWAGLAREDYLEAFRHHPKIGDINSLRAKFANTREWASSEQSGTSEASEAVLQGLATGNEAYEAKFGHIFIVCATGKRADELLAMLQSRLPNDPATELAIAAGEQAKITRLRLEKLLA